MGNTGGMGRSSKLRNDLTGYWETWVLNDALGPRFYHPHLARQFSEETRKKLSEGMKGRSTVWLTGRKASLETRAKMSQSIHIAKRGNPYPHLGTPWTQ